jgi:hypothetical protein
MYANILNEDLVERLHNYEDKVINKPFRNKMRKEDSLKLHNITSECSLRLEVKLLFSEQMKHRNSTHYIALSFVELNLKKQITDWTNKRDP